MVFYKRNKEIAKFLWENCYFLQKRGDGYLPQTHLGLKSISKDIETKVKEYLTNKDNLSTTEIEPNTESIDVKEESVKQETVVNEAQLTDINIQTIHIEYAERGELDNVHLKVRLNAQEDIVDIMITLPRKKKYFFV